MSNPNIPALDFLGYGLDMSTVTPLNIRTVAESVKRAAVLIDIDTSNSRDVEIAGKTYRVPGSVGVNTDNYSADGSFVTYASGSSANIAFQANTSLAATYGAISASASIAYAFSKSFTSTNQFALYSMNVNVYNAFVQNYLAYFQDSIVDTYIKRLNLVKPFPPSNPSQTVVDNYRTFFNIFGTHVITDCKYGSRFQLTVHASNSNTEVNNNFSANVKASFGGIMSSGQFDASIVHTEQFETYSNYMMKALAVRGGDVQLGMQIELDATSFDEYRQWVGTAGTNPSIMGFSTMELWDLMKVSIIEDVRNYAPAMQDAFKWIVLHPQLFRTHASLVIESDWAEFGLMTPSAILEVDPTSPFPQPTRTMLSRTKLFWGRERSHEHYRMTINFYIVNDGSPIDFYISHGSDGGQHTGGLAMATFENATYTNDEITDNNFNSQWFFQKPVSSVPLPSSAHDHRYDQERTWDEVLTNYLKKKLE